MFQLLVNNWDFFFFLLAHLGRMTIRYILLLLFLFNSGLQLKNMQSYLALVMLHFYWKEILLCGQIRVCLCCLKVLCDCFMCLQDIKHRWLFMLCAIKKKWVWTLQKWSATNLTVFFCAFGRECLASNVKLKRTVNIRKAAWPARVKLSGWDINLNHMWNAAVSAEAFISLYWEDWWVLICGLKQTNRNVWKMCVKSVCIHGGSMGFRVVFSLYWW